MAGQEWPRVVTILPVVVGVVNHVVREARVVTTCPRTGTGLVVLQLLMALWDWMNNEPACT